MRLKPPSLPRLRALSDPQLRRRALAVFLPWAILSSLLAGMVYVVVQQGYRTAANDPQWQVASDAAHALDGGATAAQITAGSPVDLAGNLALHISVYDSSDHLIASTARLHGSVPQPPSGVLATARAAGTNWLTWQPEPGVRVAAVAIAYSHGTVLAGRSLAIVEDDEARLLRTCVAAELVLLLAGAMVALFCTRFWPASRE